jgi:RNA polymerase sigma-70 factor (ECF subfamily)
MCMVFVRQLQESKVEHAQVTRFTTLWTQAQTSVFAVISATITNFADAEDVLQKVSTVAVSKFDAFETDGDQNAFIAWAIAIARFEILRHLRGCATDRHQYIAESLGQIAEAFEEIAPEYDRRREALAQCTRQLKGRSRDVLEKRYGEGLKTGVIAKLLGLTAGNVSVILNRTYRKLRECIDGRLAAEPDAS